MKGARQEITEIAEAPNAKPEIIVDEGDAQERIMAFLDEQGSLGGDYGHLNYLDLWRSNKWSGFYYNA